MNPLFFFGGRIPTPPPVGEEEVYDDPYQIPDHRNALPEEYYSLDRRASRGDLELVKSIMEKDRLPHDPMNLLDDEKLTLVMHRALERGHLEVAKYMLREGVLFNNRHASLATSRGWFDVLDVMIEIGWDINFVQNKACSSLLSEYLDDEQALTYYLSHGADPNARGAFDRTALSFAVARHSMSVIRRLFDHGGSVQEGQLMHFCATRELPDCTQVADYLMEKGYSDLNAILFKSHTASWEMYSRIASLGTPLQSAASQGNEPMIKWLLLNGADPNVPNTGGSLPIEVAKHRDRVGAVKIFEKWSVDGHLD